MSRVKPTEIRLIADLLQKPADDADELAERIIRSLDEKREKDERWGVVYYDPNTKAVINYGPYATKTQAQKALSGLVSPGPKPAAGIAVKLRGSPPD